VESVWKGEGGEGRYSVAIGGQNWSLGELAETKRDEVRFSGPISSAARLDCGQPPAHLPATVNVSLGTVVIVPISVSNVISLVIEGCQFSRDNSSTSPLKPLMKKDQSMKWGAIIEWTCG
jgi:hypothetical protein